MARANRHFIPGHVWHLTHRCHKREFLLKCLVYVYLNMVRAGVVDHPYEWKWSGYHEIQKPKIRYRLIDRGKLLPLLNTDTHEALADNHRRWVESQWDMDRSGRSILAEASQ